MKLINLFLLLITIIGYSQTKNDVVDFKNLNIELLNKTIFDECNKVRQENGLKPLVSDKICSYSANYQSEYMAYFSILTHRNTNVFKSQLLLNVGERFKFFNSKLNQKRFNESVFEICTVYEMVTTVNYIGITTKTYQNYAEEIIKGFLNSKYHKIVMLVDYGDIIYGSFNICYNQNTDNIYTTGVINPSYKVEKK
jgi:uncharacterized protein YkwD